MIISTDVVLRLLIIFLAFSCVVRRGWLWSVFIQVILMECRFLHQTHHGTNSPEELCLILVTRQRLSGVFNIEDVASIRLFESWFVRLGWLLFNISFSRFFDLFLYWCQIIRLNLLSLIFWMALIIFERQYLDLFYLSFKPNSLCLCCCCFFLFFCFSGSLLLLSLLDSFLFLSLRNLSFDSFTT